MPCIAFRMTFALLFLSGIEDEVQAFVVACSAERACYRLEIPEGAAETSLLECIDFHVSALQICAREREDRFTFATKRNSDRR